jgi:hypothetical protein
MLNGVGQDLAQKSVSKKGLPTLLFHTCTRYLILPYCHIGEIKKIVNRGSDSTSIVISSLLLYVLPTHFEAAVVSVVFWKLV